MRFRPNVIAAAAVLCAATQLGIELPPIPALEPPESFEEGEEFEVQTYWLDLFDVDKEELEGEFARRKQ